MCVPGPLPATAPGVDGALRGGTPPGSAPAQVLAPVSPRSAGEAVQMVLAGLGWLASADAGSLPTGVQADLLRDLERAASVHAAARARVLAAFATQAGYEDDGCGSPRGWLRWQTRVTAATAAAAVAAMRRLRSHPAIAAALAAAEISVSWARQVSDWTDQLPEDARPDADVILVAAARGGADLADLASLADQIRRRVARPDPDGGDDGLGDRRVWLSTTFAGAGSLRGELTPRCAAALQAVLESLGKKNGPQDLRSKAQRDHDALEEACRRLVASGTLPDRAGQPTQIQLHVSLDDLLRHAAAQPAGARPGHHAPGGNHGPGGHSDPDGHHRPGGHGDRAELGGPGGYGHPGGTADPGGRHEPGSAARGDMADAGPDVVPRPAWPGPAARPGDLCDAQITPIVTGHVDHDLLDRLAARLASQLATANPDHQPPRSGSSPLGHGPLGHGPPGNGSSPRGHGSPVHGPPSSQQPRPPRSQQPGPPGHGPPDPSSPGSSSPGTSSPGTSPPGNPGMPVAQLRDLLLRHAVALLSGPGALASVLRTGTLPKPAASVSLPLDVGAVTDTIPAHLRRAVIARDKHCAAAGCYTSPPGATSTTSSPAAKAARPA